MVSVKALACELPTRLGMPLSRLNVPDIKAEAVARGIVAKVSDMTIWRWLSEDAIKPWRHRSCIFPRDPDFETKAARVLDLYARQWEARPLGEKGFRHLGRRQDFDPGTPAPPCDRRARSPGGP